MTETQAKSGAAGTSTNPVDEEAADGGGAPATGRAAVGRAAVTADAPSPKFTRAPGMPPPPDQLPEESESGSDPTGDTDVAAPAAEADSQAGSATVDIGAAIRAERSAAADEASSTQRLTTSARAEQTGAAGRAGTPGRPEPSRASAGGSAETTRPIPGAQSGYGTARPAGASQSSGTGRFGFGTPGRTAGAAATGSAGAVGAARVTEAVRAARSTVSSAASRGPRRARLNLKRIDPWSVMKFSFAVSLVLFIVVIVATSVLYLALDAMGVFDSVNGTLTDMLSATGGQEGGTFKITAKGVILTSGLIGLLNVVLFTALATLGAFVYNVCADLVGGVELTLAERD
ncbi:DUF3566 domain-containing protein [Plantactinospora sp. CA-290183]|uniref:DUF3566 domain-containing protein n=1 Tax=Plantactinospora sp. CA-290183 TaxID=3240006 RepID=UPI003D91C0B5